MPSPSVLVCEWGLRRVWAWGLTRERLWCSLLSAWKSQELSGLRLSPGACDSGPGTHKGAQCQARSAGCD